MKPEASTNGKWSGPSHAPQHVSFSALSPKSPDYDDADDYNKEQSDRRCAFFMSFSFVLVGGCRWFSTPLIPESSFKY